MNRKFQLCSPTPDNLFSIKVHRNLRRKLAAAGINIHTVKYFLKPIKIL